MENKTQTVEEIIKERDRKMYGYWKSVFQDGFEDGYPAEWDKEAVEKINSQIQQSNEDYLARLEAIETITSTDFAEDMHCKLYLNDGRDKETFTQEDAQEMVRALTDIYLIAHGGVSSCCKGKHTKLVEQYKLERAKDNE